jgi:hypothetical protein
MLQQHVLFLKKFIPVNSDVTFPRLVILGIFRRVSSSVLCRAVFCTEDFRSFIQASQEDTETIIHTGNGRNGTNWSFSKLFHLIRHKIIVTVQTALLNKDKINE